MTSFQLARKLSGLLLFSLSLCMPPTLSAQEAGEEGIKITSNTSKNQDNFGKSVALHGEYSVVGAWTEDEKGPEAGAAYIYIRNGDSSQLVKKLTASDGGAFHNFGSKVAMQGDYIIVSAQGNDDFAGAVYVYYRNEGGTDNWGEVQKLMAKDRRSGDYFGTSLAINNDQIAIGAYGVDDKGRSSGAVYTYQLNGAAWSATGKVSDNEGAANDRFGSSVAIDEQTLIVGASRDNKAGSIVIFEKAGDDWKQSLKIFASDGKAMDRFGNSISLDKNRLAVGADCVDGFMGAVYLFERNLGGSNNWGELAKIQAEDGDVNDHFGKSISLSGEYLLIGSEGHEMGMGATYLFRKDKDGENSWGMANKMSAVDGSPRDLFGASVALSGEDILIGAYQSNNIGGAYTFKTMDKGMFARKD